MWANLGASWNPADKKPPNEMIILPAEAGLSLHRGLLEKKSQRQTFGGRHLVGARVAERPHPRSHMLAVCW